MVSDFQMETEVLFSFFFLDFIYLFMRDTEGRETQAEGEAGSSQGA